MNPSRAGLLAAILSSALGGTAIVATRFLASALDPIALGSFRFGIGFALLLPLALVRRDGWPRQGVLLVKTAGLGVLFFALFPVLFNLALHDTTAARGALALSTLPLLTMLVAALLGVEHLSARKIVGVLIAMSGVAAALLSGLSSAADGAWRGDLTMAAAALCMAFYSVLSRAVIRATGPLPFTVVAMGIGASCLVVLTLGRGGYAPVADLDVWQWMSLGFLGFFGGAIVFLLWSYALAKSTPTLVALSVTVNPIAAALVGWAALSEPVGVNLAIGLALVFAGITVATWTGSKNSSVT